MDRPNNNNNTICIIFLSLSLYFFLNFFFPPRVCRGHLALTTPSRNLLQYNNIVVLSSHNALGAAPERRTTQRRIARLPERLAAGGGPALNSPVRRHCSRGEVKYKATRAWLSPSGVSGNLQNEVMWIKGKTGARLETFDENWGHKKKKIAILEVDFSEWVGISGGVLGVEATINRRFRKTKIIPRLKKKSFRFVSQFPNNPWGMSTT